MVTLDDVRAAAVRIRGVALRTPLLDAGPLALKCENLQPMGAFKVRGACNMIAQLPPESRARGVITYSSGNHGQAVALVEARTFPPPAWDPHNVAACGEFLEITLPAHELEPSSRFWRALGFVQVADGVVPHAWQRLTGFGVTIGLHEAHCRPGLSFRCTDVEARCEYLRAKGLGARAGNPIADRAQPSAALTAPEGTQLYLLEKGSQ